MNTPNDEGKPMWKHPVFLGVFVVSVLIFAGLGFGFLREFTTLPLWADILIALPAGVLTFMLLLWLTVISDGPRR